MAYHLACKYLAVGIQKMRTLGVISKVRILFIEGISPEGQKFYFPFSSLAFKSAKTSMSPRVVPAATLLI